MKQLVTICAAALLLAARPAASQSSPSLDPSFPVLQIYQRTTAQAALQLSSGARVVVGYFDRAAGQPYSFTSSGLVRYLPTGAPDLLFNATTAADAFSLATLAEAANGKLLLGLNGPGTFGGQLSPALVQLNADGTRDAAFANLLGSNGSVSRILVQPDGRIVVGGTLAFLGQNPAPGLARLNADGTVDTTFQPQLASGRIVNVNGLARQADGKLLVAAYVQNGTAGSYQLLRLQANGTQDLSFQPTLQANVILGDVAVQSDGQVLVSGGFGPVLPGGTATLARFSTTGVPDATFSPSPNLYASSLAPLPLLAVQPDGRILVGHAPPRVATALPAGHSPVARLLASGAFDPAWNVPALPADDLLPRATSMQLLATGQVLVAGTTARLGAADEQERGAVVLDATGQPTNTFRPVLQQNGYVRDVTQQPDGRLVAVGSFSEVSDLAARGIVRLELNGSVDTAFCRRARFSGGYGTQVLAQPDGTLLSAGTFTAVGGGAQAAIVRLLATGAPDAAFPSPFASSTSVTELARQADGRVLLGGTLRLPGTNTVEPFLRLDPNGAIDAGFQPPAGVTPLALLPLPGGTILVGSAATGRQVLRLLATGAADASFTVPVLSAAGTSPAVVSTLARQSDGRLLIGGSFAQVGGLATMHVARLLADGPPDPTFSSQQLPAAGRASAVAVQPNGRVLLAGSPALVAPANTPVLYRLLADGSPDPSFNSSRGPNLGRSLLGVSRVLVQADGAIVAAGGFTAVSSLPVLGLTRLLDANVLALRSAGPASEVQVWPVPAHNELHLALALSQPRRVSLVNTLGQVVFRQENPGNDLTINTSLLKPGLYVVRVDYTGMPPAIRRVLLE
ncbi:MAG: hypothetical protein JWP58_104 [Hymenobacter sp.]|nr:hypothetical protein [Hymenobacter sp.]